MKKSVIILLVVIVAAAGYFYFTKSEVTFSKETTPYKAVPTSTPVFVEFSSLKAIPRENQMLDELTNIAGFKNLLEEMEKLKATIINNREIPGSWGKASGILALDFIGKNVLKPLIIVDIKRTPDHQALQQILSKMLQAPVTSFVTRKYDGYDIVDIKLSSSGNTMHYCALGRLLVVSPETMLVEKSIRQFNSQNITDNKNFIKLTKLAEAQSNIAWFINHKRFPDLWTNYLNGEAIVKKNEFGQKTKINLRESVRSIQGYASWSELDMEFKERKVLMQGVTAVDDSLNHFLSVFDGQEAVSGQEDRVLPANTSFFIAFTFSERELFFKKLEYYFEHANSYFNRESNIKEIEKVFRVDSRNTLRKLVKNRVVAALTTVPADPNKKNSLFIINNNHQDESKTLFEGMLQNYAKRKSVDFDSLCTKFTSENGETHLLYQFPFPSLPGIWLGKAFSFAEARFACFFDDNLIFASSEKALKAYIHDLESGRSLYRNHNYREFKRNAESKSNISTYLNVNRAYNLNKVIFSSSIAGAIDKNEEVLRKFDAMAWQVVCTNDTRQNFMQLGLKKAQTLHAGTVWQSDVGASIEMKPKVVVNHRNTAEKEIIVQDKDNILHLIAADGNIIWSMPLDNKILGEIHQIDYYRNGRLQYLFNTKEKLYLLDRTGKKVANFPIAFESPATNGVNVFDYDNNRKYRYFVACQNYKVYAYNHAGEIIRGWKFGKTESAVTTQVQHFRVQNKDYIVFKDKSKVYIQNRQGETRVDCAAKFENSHNPLVLNSSGKPKIIASDSQGKVYYLFFDGKYKEIETARFSKNHFFTVDDIDGNGILEYVYVDGKELKVINEKGEKLFSEKFDNLLKQGAQLYSFSATHKKIGVCDSKENEIYLFDFKGELHPGFPLRGRTEFSIAKLKEEGLNLLVGGSNGELYNYFLE